MRRLRNWGVFFTLFAASVCFAGEPVVQIGAARLADPVYSELLRGKAIAALAHHASRLPDGTHLVDLLARSSGFDLKMIFAPEHGYRSVDDDLLPDSKDPETGLPVYSLYGPRRAPTPEMLARVDAVVVDLQDVGLRYYTYPATLVYTMQACKRAGKKVIVLDRPNPLSGSRVEGVVLDKKLAAGGLTNLAPVSTRHGMTLGELAFLYNQMLGIGTDLTVIPMKGWARSMRWEDTGLTWHAPSPALVDSEQAELYAMFGTLEAANLAVGRGQANALAFRAFGAPWILKEELPELIAKLNGLKLPGLEFEAIEWIPDRAIYEGKLSRGFRVRVLDLDRVQSFRSLIETLTLLNRELGDRLKISGTKIMLGSAWILEGIQSGAPSATLIERAERESAEFLRLRGRALLY